ncbi:MAG: outer membrane beta-barrel protein [Paenibacillus sp.]|nr:outer membrane beta-barrel protein [Paenibacillus sp.]
MIPLLSQEPLLMPTAKFSIVNDHKSGIFLLISAIGFEDKSICAPIGDIGTIALVPATLQLDEITVKASRPVTRLKNDGIQVAVSGSYLANTGTAFELLGKMPFVSKTGSNLEVIGKGSPLVYINGRQVRDTSELNQLASTDIKSVDIVTSPGARYASSANSVIRITTITPDGEGLSFNDRTTIGYKHYVYLFEQVNLNWRKNGIDLFGMVNYENYRERPRYDSNTIKYLKPETVIQHSLGKDFARYPVNQGKIGLNYNSGNKYAGFYYDFSFRPASVSNRSFTNRLSNKILEDELEYSGLSTRHNRQHLLSAYYTGTSGKWLLDVNLDAIWHINDRRTAERESSTKNTDRNFSTFNDVGNRMLAGNISASRPTWRGTTCMGVEISDINRKDRYMTDADYISDNDTEIRETTSALFWETTQTFGKISVSAGLRWEYTDSRYYIYNEKMPDQSRKYHNLAPSASVSFPVGNISARLSYVRKTTRPAFEQLSSSIRYLDRYNYESGNPNLKPIYRDYVSLSCSWRDVILEVNYCSTKNYFMWQTTPYAECPDATLLKIENMPRYNSFEAFANYSPCFFGIWRPVFMAGVVAQDFRIVHNGLDLKLNKPLGIFRLNNAIHLPMDIWLNLDFSARTSGSSDNLYVKRRWNCDLGIYKSFGNDTWSMKLQFNDMFHTDRQLTVSYDAISATRIDLIHDTHDISLTIRYNFNPARSRFRGQGAANSEKSRL